MKICKFERAESQLHSKEKWFQIVLFYCPFSMAVKKMRFKAKDSAIRE